TDIHQSPRFGDVGVAPGAEELTFAAEGSRAKTQHRHLQARCAKTSKFHACILWLMGEVIHLPLFGGVPIASVGRAVWRIEHELRMIVCRPWKRTRAKTAL